MDERQNDLRKAYKRGAIGLAVAAILWTAALLTSGLEEGDKMNWLVPICAAALSLLCFSLYTKSKQ